MTRWQLGLIISFLITAALPTISTSASSAHRGPSSKATYDESLVNSPASTSKSSRALLASGSYSLRPNRNLAGSLPLSGSTAQAEIPDSLVNSASDGRELSCVYLGGVSSGNLCLPDPSRTISNVFSLDVDAYNYNNPTEKIKILCDSWGCTQVPVYYSMSCSVNWSTEISDYDQVTAQLYVKNSTRNWYTPINVTEVPCGNGENGSCNLNLLGVFPANQIKLGPLSGFSHICGSGLCRYNVYLHRMAL